jgi:hypothetical protein
MNDLIAVPTVEQINLEHQLANSKANEAVQHATNCGLMLLQVKASKQHGEWLPWLKQQQESGAIQVSQQTASKYMKLASNYNRERNLIEAPSIRAALELLSDKEPVEQQGELIDAERQAREIAEQKAESERARREAAERVLVETQQRASEFGQESNERRLKIRELETRIDTLIKQSTPEQEVIEKEVIPADYESAKRQASEFQVQTEALQKQLESLQKQQSKLVNDQVKAKLQGYQEELNKLEEDKRVIEDIVARKKAYLDSLDNEVKRIETHQDVINGVRLELISLAAFLNDMEPMNDPATVRKWLALAGMCREATGAIDLVFGKTGLELAA